jgi:hypothetical protein
MKGHRARRQFSQAGGALPFTVASTGPSQLLEHDVLGSALFPLTI